MNSKKFMIRSFMALLLLAAQSLISCGGQNSDQLEDGKSTMSALHTIRINDQPLQVEIAQTPEASSLGLMFRESLPEDQGMLFVFPQQQILSFWMRNTFIPLDIAFIDHAGVIVDIQRMAPLDETINYISAAPALYALEVNAGWFEKREIKVGARVRF
jgi:hypothetical protein